MGPPRVAQPALVAQQGAMVLQRLSGHMQTSPQPTCKLMFMSSKPVYGTPVFTTRQGRYVHARTRSGRRCMWSLSSHARRSGTLVNQYDDSPCRATGFAKVGWKIMLLYTPASAVERTCESLRADACIRGGMQPSAAPAPASADGGTMSWWHALLLPQRH